eukprot:Gb_32333 [translate_table: standard]
MTTIRLLLNIVAQFSWEIHQMDVKSAFLNGKLEEEAYMHQPEGFIRKEQENLVCKLKKALYGLKQAPRAWYAKIDEHFKNNGFTKSELDNNLFVKITDGDILIVSIYVDNLIIGGSDNSLIKDLKT